MKESDNFAIVYIDYEDKSLRNQWFVTMEGCTSPEIEYCPYCGGKLE